MTDEENQEKGQEKREEEQEKDEGGDELKAVSQAEEGEEAESEDARGKGAGN